MKGTSSCSHSLFFCFFKVRVLIAEVAFCLFDNCFSALSSRRRVFSSRHNFYFKVYLLIILFNRFLSPVDKNLVLLKCFFCFVVLFWAKWEVKAQRRLTLPEPVILNLFQTAFLFLILFIIFILALRSWWLKTCLVVRVPTRSQQHLLVFRRYCLKFEWHHFF